MKDAMQVNMKPTRAGENATPDTQLPQPLTVPEDGRSTMPLEMRLGIPNKLDLQVKANQALLWMFAECSDLPPKDELEALVIVLSEGLGKVANDAVALLNETLRGPAYATERRVP